MTTWQARLPCHIKYPLPHPHEVDRWRVKPSFAALREALATLYPAEQDAHVVVADAGLDATQIAFSSPRPNQLAQHSG